MKNIGKKIIITGVVLWLFGAWMIKLYEDDAAYQHEQLQKTIYRSDPKRTVHAYDYGTNTYIYKDEVQPREEWDNANNKPAIPDFYVQGMKNPKSKLDRPAFIWIEGKRYSVRYRSNNNIEIELDE